MNDDSMHDAPIDFAVLDPTRDTARFQAVTAGIAREAMAARSRRPPADVLADLASWWRPALVAAAIVFAVAIPALAVGHIGRSAAPAPASTADVLGIPRQLMDLLESRRTPSLVQINQALASIDGSAR